MEEASCEPRIVSSFQQQKKIRKYMKLINEINKVSVYKVILQKQLFALIAITTY
jgi:hypothetical protein